MIADPASAGINATKRAHPSHRLGHSRFTVWRKHVTTSEELTIRSIAAVGPGNDQSARRFRSSSDSHLI